VMAKEKKHVCKWEVIIWARDKNELGGAMCVSIGKRGPCTKLLTRGQVEHRINAHERQKRRKP